MQVGVSDESAEGTETRMVPGSPRDFLLAVQPERLEDVRREYGQRLGRTSANLFSCGVEGTAEVQLAGITKTEVSRRRAGLRTEPATCAVRAVAAE